MGAPSASVATGASEVNRLLTGALFLTFSASLLDMATFIAAGKTTTHQSGATAKAGLYLGAGNWTKMEPVLLTPWCFFLGSLAAGFSTSRKEWKNLDTCAAAMLVVGVLACVAGAMLEAGRVEGIYVAALAAGLQNAMLTTITGFVRSTHVTGTWTDIGLLMGQAWPDKMNDPAHWWKTKILTALLAAFYVGGVVSHFVDDVIPGKLAYVSGGITMATGLVGAAHCHAKRRASAAIAALDEAATNEVVPFGAPSRPRFSAPATLGGDVESGKRPVFKRLVRNNVAVVNQAMNALLEISKEMAGNINSMPDPPEKVVATVMAVNKAANIFKAKTLSTRSLTAALEGMSEDYVKHTQAKLGAVCYFLIQRPELMEELDRAVEGGKVFVAAAAVPHAAEKLVLP